MIIFPDISPNLFSFNIGGFELAIRWYALAYIIGILLGWQFALLAIRRVYLWPKNRPPLESAQVENLLTWVIVGVILGGRLGYVIFYKPIYYLANPGQILMLWNGGMAFHGGLVGVIIAAFLFYRRNNVTYASGADLLALCTPVGLLLGRLANFINAELWGRATNLPWGVAFPGEAAQACGQVTGLCARHPSQLYEAFLEGLVLLLLLTYISFRRKALTRPGLVTGTFFAGYGIARFIVEFARQPDLHFQSADNPLGYWFYIENFGITMGQILSLPMIFVGLALVIHAIHRPVS